MDVCGISDIVEVDVGAIDVVISGGLDEVGRKVAAEGLSRERIGVVMDEVVVVVSMGIMAGVGVVDVVDDVTGAMARSGT